MFWVSCLVPEKIKWVLTISCLVFFEEQKQGMLFYVILHMKIIVHERKEEHINVHVCNFMFGSARWRKILMCATSRLREDEKQGMCAIPCLASRERSKTECLDLLLVTDLQEV